MGPLIWIHLVGALLSANTLDAVPGSATVIRAGIERWPRRWVPFTRRPASHGVASRIATLVQRHGPAVEAVVQQCGPQVLPWLERAGEQAPQLLRILARHGPNGMRIISHPGRLKLVRRYGDDVAQALLQHGDAAEPLLTAFGKPAARSLLRVTPQNGRRLAMLQAEGTLPRIGRTPELLRVIEQHGDAALEFVWRHKGALAVTAVLTAFLADPAPFLTGAVDVTELATSQIAAPLVAVPGQVAVTAAQGIDWNAWLLIASAWTGLLLWFRQRRGDGTRPASPSPAAVPQPMREEPSPPNSNLTQPDQISRS